MINAPDARGVLCSPDTQKLIRHHVTNAHIEVIPLRSALEGIKAFPTARTLTVTCSSKFGLDRSLELCSAAVAHGHQVIPHVAARQIPDREALRTLVGRLVGLGIRTLFVVGGDIRDPVGKYRNARQLLDDLSGLNHGIEHIGVPCYPEGHPKITQETLLDDLHHKQEYAHYMVSQLCFDAATIVTWLRSVRQEGIALPLRLGLAAPMNAAKLVRLSLKIGVGSSLRFLSKQHGIVGNLIGGSEYRPEDLLARIGNEQRWAELSIAGVHLFSFNQIESTTAWQSEIARRMAA
ncbi:methylenetetrahydrofolate reductase [Amycolatopsis sacchari]|uniref:methylenetetrahydrofolate reductase n=1 Tax=Amycolatopsis sacchari TaxID=115433 RepID=UPI003EBAD6E8